MPTVIPMRVPAFQSSKIRIIVARKKKKVKIFCGKTKKKGKKT